jgi:hypothetical protein
VLFFLPAACQKSAGSGIFGSKGLLPGAWQEKKQNLGVIDAKLFIVKKTKIYQRRSNNDLRLMAFV